MSKRLLIGALSVVLVTGLVAAVSFADQLRGTLTLPPHAGAPGTDGPCTLFEGDLGAEMGLGCSNVGGTSGGPNDVVQMVTATLTPPLFITSHFYNIFTQVSPTITALSFIYLLNSGGSPGMELGRRAGMDWTLGDHTVPIAPPVTVVSASFFFGHNQPQSNVGMRWGLDTGSSAGKSWIRAPACGLAVFGTLDSIGFPGNWVMSVTVDCATPVELTSWGAVKEAYK